MLSAAKSYPVFDHLEVEFELEFDSPRFRKLAPLHPGDLVKLPTATSTNWHHYFNEVLLNSNAPSLSYTRKPLLLYFFEQEWGLAATQHLKQLNQLADELQHNRINLLVVTTAAGVLQQLLDDHQLSLDVYEDTDAGIASLLGIYSEQSPTWDTYAGIERNIPLPALYLLDHSRKVAFAYPNKEIESNLPLNNVLDNRVIKATYHLVKQSA